MPSVFLSPSLQPFNQYVTGGNEQYYMNLIVDAMEPYLLTNGIQFDRNEIGSSLAQSIAQSNQGNYGLHLALHSNASPSSLTGILKGTDVYYRPDSYQGKNAAEIIADNFKKIYPYPSLVKAVPTTTLSELNLTRNPAVLMEIAYHDNIEDVTWLKANIDNIAANLVESLTIFFDIPFITPPTSPVGGFINASNVNVRLKPSTDSYIITTLQKNTPVMVLGTWQDWNVISTGDITGYVFSQYITTT